MVAARQQPPGPTIECKYSCFECSLDRVTVLVPARLAEQVTEWLERTCIPALMADHQRRSPRCHPVSFSEVMIPIPPGVDKVGGAVKN